ncbi:MAG TPA: hypothetical protein VLC73_06420 [Burkholderiales bacterium]|nr:hypothetical protein [Burkholderiales bacterium]
MSRSSTIRALAAAAWLALLSSCAPMPPERGVLTTPESQLKLRSIQTRAYDTSDRQFVLRGVIATLQDLEFMIEAADAALGTVTARKFLLPRGTPLGRDLTLTVTVRPRGEKQMLVRLNAEFNRKAVEDPEVYQSFFLTLGRSLFLSGHEVE